VGLLEAMGDSPALLPSRAAARSPSASSASSSAEEDRADRRVLVPQQSHGPAPAALEYESPACGHESHDTPGEAAGGTPDVGDAAAPALADRRAARASPAQTWPISPAPTDGGPSAARAAAARGRAPLLLARPLEHKFHAVQARLDLVSATCRRYGAALPELAATLQPAARGRDACNRRRKRKRNATQTRRKRSGNTPIRRAVDRLFPQARLGSKGATSRPARPFRFVATRPRASAAPSLPWLPHQTARSRSASDATSGAVRKPCVADISGDSGSGDSGGGGGQPCGALAHGRDGGGADGGGNRAPSAQRKRKRVAGGQEAGALSPKSHAAHTALARTSNRRNRGGVARV
jgi:hypothetical protein